MRGILKAFYGKMASPFRTRIISNSDLPGLLFGQQHILTQSFFTERFGQSHTVRLEQLPHYEFLCKHRDTPFADHLYSQYLACSWDYYYGKAGNTEQRRRQKTEDFLALYRAVKLKRERNERAIERAIEVCELPDGRIVIVHGNHRAAVALELGIDLRATFLPLREFLGKVVAVPKEFYGTKRLNRPYQSICYGGEELLQGRRPDILERLQRLPKTDLQGKTVLDLGCNVGMNCYLAVDRGAVKAVGVDASPKIASAAVRLNTLFTAPCHFIVHDLNEELGEVGQFDTVLCFSLVRHLKSTDGIVATIRRTTRRVLYFEGHADTRQNDYDYLLNADNFSKIECIGYGHDGVHVKTRTRPQFRCEV